MDADDAALFTRYHREERGRRARVVVITGAVIALPIAFLIAVGSAAPASSPAVAAPQPAASSTPVPTIGPTVAAQTLPEPSAQDAATPAPVETAPPATGPWSIDITAVGYQPELDACQWVRMDLGAEAPFVGAHRSCGGAIVLQMAVGQQVRLTGEGLDGGYVVVSDRDAHAGDVAVDAVAGLPGTVYLQTCYPGTSGTVRLVGLSPA